ncbi:MAG: hypothetical protein JWR80_469 [Bradyrhizobium sp.]|nr:hypothetical protein [Bradyrhizobium sp.]
MSVDREAVTAAPKGERKLRTRNAGMAATIVLTAASILLSLVLLEVGCRLLLSGPGSLTHWPNLARERMGTGPDVTRERMGTSPDVARIRCQYAYDAQIGWTSPPNCISRTYSADADGFRRTSPTSSLAEPPVLVTGSSFAKGDEVNDDETWPADLQNLIGRKVVNAGVSGYAFDQTVLSTERLVPRVKPLFVVASFTPGDIRRSELKIAWSREKPYFTVADGKLELRNVPVPGQANAPVPLPEPARWLGRSALADLIVQRLGIQRGWYFDEVRGAPFGSGEAIVCLLMPRLAALGVPVVVMAQYSREYWTESATRRTEDHRAVQAVLGCASEAGLIPFDLSNPMKAVIDAKGVDALYRSDHHSAEGNRVVADIVLRELVGRRLVAQTADR